MNLLSITTNNRFTKLLANAGLFSKLGKKNRKQEETAVSSNDTYFNNLRENTIGTNQEMKSVYGKKELVYLDWTASGRLYNPIEAKLVNVAGPFVANTHTESNTTGSFTTKAYHKAQKIIKNHVNASNDDILINYHSGTTAVINKLQRILGLRVDEEYLSKLALDSSRKPVVFITHMEHHSNHTSWLETIADVVIVEPNENGEVEPRNLEKLLIQYQDRPLKIGSFSACSNVTGVMTPYHQMAELMHKHAGYCFVDFAASAPYVEINMHPENPMQRLDAIFFSPHKFLGGPASSGVLIFNSSLYHKNAPDNPGGGTVSWTNPWGGKKYVDNIEAREDGGTPPFLQVMKTALCIKLKEEMLQNNMQQRKDALFKKLWNDLKSINEVVILDEDKENRLSIISFYLDIPDFCYNLVVKMLDERFGIQVRGGCSCAGTYGHYLLNIDQKTSKDITNEIDKGILSRKPGWIRVSLHPINTFEEIETFSFAIRQVIANYNEWKKDYTYNPSTNEYSSCSFLYEEELEELFTL